MTYTERRIMLHPLFVEALKMRWPAALPADCAKIDASGADCLDRVDPEMCASCTEYDRLADLFDTETDYGRNLDGAL